MVFLPILYELGVALFPLLAALVLAGLSQSITSQQGSADTPGLWAYLSGGLLAQLGGFATKLARYVVSHFGEAQLRLISRWLMGIGTLASGLLVALPTFAEAVENAFGRVEHAVTHIGREVATVRHALNVFRAKVNTEIRHLTHTVTVTIPRELGRIRADVRKAEHAIEVTLPRAIGRVHREEEALSRDLAKLRDRTKSLEDGAEETWNWIRTHPLSGTTAIFTGAVAIALARLGYGFLRCNNWKSLGKRLTCGMGAFLHGLLDLAAVFALSLLATLDPEALAHVTVKAVDVIEPQLQRMLDAAPSESSLQSDIDRFTAFLGL